MLIDHTRMHTNEATLTQARTRATMHAHTHTHTHTQTNKSAKTCSHKHTHLHARTHSTCTHAMELAKNVKDCNVCTDWQILDCQAEGRNLHCTVYSLWDPYLSTPRRNELLKVPGPSNRFVIKAPRLYLPSRVCGNAGCDKEFCAPTAIPKP
jgi:hypothetical protein